MYVLRPIPALFSRNVSTTAWKSSMKAVISARQQAKMMDKFLSAAKKKERQLMTALVADSGGLAGADGDCSTTGEPARIRPLRSASSRHRHRLEALSAIYLERITELLQTGELLPSLLDSGLVVRKVQLSGNMRLLYVFWACLAGADERLVTAQLVDAGPLLRTALTQQRLTGHVPGVKFLKDVESGRLQEIERRLALADFGPDFVPTDPTHLVKRRGALGRPVTARHTAPLLGLCAESAAAGCEVHPPLLPHTTAGLDRAAILSEVEGVMLKASAPHRQVELHPEAVAPAAAGHAAREELLFERFTKQRKWARMRQNKVSSEVDLREWEMSRRQRTEQSSEQEQEQPGTERTPPIGEHFRTARSGR